MKTLFQRYVIFIAAAAVVAQIVSFFIYQNAPAFIGLVGSIFIAGLLAAGVAKLIAGELAKIAATCSKALAKVAKGEKDQAIEHNRKDEIGALIDAVNGLLDRDKAVKQANEDPLTGLANRRYLTQRLNELVASKKPLALMFIDLDGFKPINDTHGHDVGDEALKMVSERLGACVRETDVLCRLGGDEFVILFNGLSDREVIKERADKVLELINQPYWINGTRVRMGASLGIAIAPDDGKTGEEVLNAADESMYAAKQGGKNAYRFYS